MAVIMSKQIVLPAIGKRLSDYAHGDIVKLEENGRPVEFYVAKHDYESGLNGAGRTLLVRKDIYTQMSLNQSPGYGGCDSNVADTMLNGTYKALFDPAVQEAMVTTTIYCSPGTKGSTVSTMSRSVFMLSLTEYGLSTNRCNVEGSALPIASILGQAVYYNGTMIPQYTRSPSTSSDSHIIAVQCVDSRISVTWSHVNSCAYGVRPALTLPGETLFDPDTNVFKGVR